MQVEHRSIPILQPTSITSEPETLGVLRSNSSSFGYTHPSETARISAAVVRSSLASNSPPNPKLLNPRNLTWESQNPLFQGLYPIVKGA